MIWNPESYLDRYLDGFFESLDEKSDDAELGHIIETVFDLPLSFFYSSKVRQSQYACGRSCLRKNYYVIGYQKIHSECLLCSSIP